MNSSNAVATLNSATQLRPVADFEITREQIELIKRTVMPQASDLELDLFINLCRSKRLDPLTKQIYAIKTERSGWQFFASIDGLRVIAQRSGEYLGQTAPFWCGPDGQWRDVWLEDEPPAAAKIGVWKRGNSEPTWGVATFREYGKGKKAPIWLSMPAVMLSKCSEAIALRKAFPDDLSALYVREEFTEASDPPATTRTPPRPRIDVVEAQTRGYSKADLDRVIDGEVVDDDTGEIRQLQPIQQEQMREIVTLKRGLNWDSQTIRTFSLDRVGKADSGQLSAEEADYLIEQLRLEQDRMLAPVGQWS